MLSLARHSRSAASFIFRTACCYHHPPSASRPRGAFPASNRGLWQTSNIVRCSRPLRCGIPRYIKNQLVISIVRLRLRGVGSMASGGGDASAASEKIARTVREGDSSSAVDMGLKNGRGDGAEEKEAEKRPEDVPEQNEKENGDEDEEDEGEEEEEEEDEEEDEEEEEEEEDRLRVGERFQLTGSSSLVLQRGDITKWCVDGKTDVIVNAANEMMLGGGGVDGAIHRAAGKKLLDACYKVPEVSRGVRCPVGSAVITPGFNLPASRVIHTVGPMYHKEDNPAEILGKAYRKCIDLAVKEKVKYIAFPAISCGIYGYPYEEAAKVSIEALQETAGQMTEVHFVFFEAGTYNAWLSEAEEKLSRIKV